jgi:multisubunit Na+/H+ antiporter MnhB subunit
MMLRAKGINMNNITGLAILALGVVLLIFGFNESHSFTSDVSRTFTGNPTDRSMWLIIGGAVAVVAGIGVAVAGRRRK